MRISLMLAAWLLASAAQATTLADLLDGAWRTDPEARALTARAGELKARIQAVDSLLAGAPAVSVSYRADSFGSNDGKREYEAEVSLPVWLPGQRNANRDALMSELAALDAARAALRLKILGELREKNAALRRVDVELALSESRLVEARALEADVDRRYKAGDMARTDLLAARMETLVVMGELAERQSAREVARAALMALTGFDQSAPPETPFTTGSQAQANVAHPELESRKSALAAAREKLRAAQLNRRDSPELSLFGRRDRGSSAGGYENSLGVRFRLPFATEARNAPILAQSQGEVDVLEAQLEQAMRLAEASIRQATVTLEATQKMLSLAQQHADLSMESYRHIRRAFDYGERDLSSLLRAKALADAAKLQAALAEVQTAFTIARLNQAQGVMP